MRYLVVCLALLVGCASGTNQEVGRIRAALTPARIAAIDVPMVLVEAPDIGVAATLLQVGRNGDVITWQTRDGVQLSVRAGVIVATRGFGHDVMSSDTSGVQRALASRAGTHRRVWSEPDGDFGLVFRYVDCVMGIVGRHRNDGLAGPPMVTRLREVCDGPDGTIRNWYDVGPDGFIWASSQWVTPQIGSLQVTVVKR